jgi:6-phosphogluconolactonase (cycloisomerase 2 family)
MVAVSAGFGAMAQSAEAIVLPAAATAPVSVAISADGLEAFGAGESRLRVYELGALAPELSAVTTFVDGVDGVSGIGGSIAVALDPAGESVYVAGFLDDAVALFERDPFSGDVAFVEAVFDGGPVTGLNGPSAVTVSDDGQVVYATGADSQSIVSFERDPVTGALTFVGAEVNGVDGVTGLGSARSVVSVADGQAGEADVYVAGFADDAIAFFEAGPVPGALAYRSTVFQGLDGVRGLGGVTALARTPGRDPAAVDLLAVGFVSDAVSVFARNADGTLAQIDVELDNVGSVRGMNGPTSVAIHPDGETVYVGSCLDQAIVVFSRDAATGLLEFVEDVRPPGLAGIQDLAVSPTGDSVVVADRAGVFEFSLDPRAGLFSARPGATEAAPAPSGGARVVRPRHRVRSDEAEPEVRSVSVPLAGWREASSVERRWSAVDVFSASASGRTAWRRTTASEPPRLAGTPGQSASAGTLMRRREIERSGSTVPLGDRAGLSASEAAPPSPAERHGHPPSVRPASPAGPGAAESRPRRDGRAQRPGRIPVAGGSASGDVTAGMPVVVLALAPLLLVGLRRRLIARS